LVPVELAFAFGAEMFILGVTWGYIWRDGQRHG